MHTFMVDGNNADIAVCQSSPIDDMPLNTKEKTFDTKLRRNGLRWDFASFDLCKRCEEPVDVPDGLLISPAIPIVAIDSVEAQ